MIAFVEYAYLKHNFLMKLKNDWCDTVAANIGPADWLRGEKCHGIGLLLLFIPGSWIRSDAYYSTVEFQHKNL